MANAWIIQRSQWGDESVAGTAVAADRVLPDLEVDFDPVIPETQVRSMGNRHPTDVIYGAERTDFTFNSDATNPMTLRYLFNSLLLTEALTTPANGVLTRRSTFAPASSAVNAFKTYTIELGAAGATNGRRIDYAVITDLSLTFTKDKGVSLKGKGFGRETAGGITMTATPTEVAQPTFAPTKTDVFLTDTLADVFTDQVEALSITLNWAKVHGDVYKLNSAEASFSTTVHAAPDLSAQVVLDYDDAVTLATLTKLRASTLMYCGIRARGALIESVTPDYYHQADLSFPFKFKDPKWGNNQDILAETLDLTILHDPAFNTTGGAFKAVIDTTAQTL